MVPRRIKFEDWVAERAANDPNWNRDAEREYSDRTPPRVKVPILCDESLEDELVADLRMVRTFKVSTLPAGRGDDYVWARACQRGLVLVTGDEDFWDDRRYPLAESPGVVILQGSGVERRTTAMARLAVVMGLPRLYAFTNRLLFLGTKTRASPDRVFTRFVDQEGSMIELEW